MDYYQIFSQFRCVVQFLQSIKAKKSCESNKMKKNEPSFKTVYKWVNEFTCRTSTRDEPHSGRPVEAAMPEIIEKVHDMVLNDRSTSESARNCWSYRHITWYGNYNFPYEIVYEKATDKMLTRTPLAPSRINATV